MRVLGISAFHRDSAAALVVDGVPVAAAQEERFTKKRLDASFPRRAARFCLDRAGLTSAELDAVVFYEKPLRKFERTLAMQLRAFPRSSTTFSKSMFLWLGDRLWLKARICEELALPPAKVFFVEHQRAHAAIAFLASPFDEAAILTLDDQGEWASAALARGSKNWIEVLNEIHFPHSLGMWYSAFAQFLGFEAGLDEERVEALARFGKPRFASEVGATIPALEGGAFTVDTERFRFSFDDENLFERALESSFGAARMPGSPLRMTEPDTRDADLAASVQAVLEERVLALARKLHELTGMDAVCLGGEVARNRALVARLALDGPFSRVFVPPSPGESGAAIGAALDFSATIHAVARASAAEHARLGERIGLSAEEGALQVANAGEMQAEQLASGKLLGWVRGEIEIGPRSFGNRVILGSARGADARQRLLGALQQAEEYMPCRVVAPAERAEEWFEIPQGCAEALRFGHVDVKVRDALRGLAPSLVGPGGTAWVQLIDAARDPGLHALLVELGLRTGAPLAAMSSFQLRGQPIVRSEADAVEAFGRSGLDALWVEDRLYERAAAR